MKTAEELLMEFIGKYASHWICADDDFPKDLNKIVDAIQTPQQPSEEKIRQAISKYEDIITEFLIGIGVDAGGANNARETLIKELLNR